MTLMDVLRMERNNRKKKEGKVSPAERKERKMWESCF
jgi:hypothetical protein